MDDPGLLGPPTPHHKPILTIIMPRLVRKLPWKLLEAAVLQ